MKLKLIATALLAASTITAGVAPASAQFRRSTNEYSRRTRDFDRTDQRKREMVDRAEQISERARTLYQNGRLSRDHYNRTMVKFDRIWDDAKDRDALRGDRFRANMDYLDQVENTLNAWSRSNSRRDERYRIDRRR
jgi:hypothetical protein